MEILESIQNVEFWFAISEQFRELGPLAPISLAMIEAFVPALPLLLIVAFNTSQYGFVLGFIYSYLGVIFGSYLVFLFFRTVIKGYFMNRFYHGHRLANILNWIESQPPLFLFFVSAIPFTPSSLINAFFGLSGYRKRLFFMSVALGKTISVTIMAFFGHSLSNIMERPLALLLSTILIILAYIISQYYQKHSGLDKLH